MSLPITFTETENRMLQEVFTEIYQDDRVRSLEGDLILSIVKLLEIWPIAPVFTEQQNRRMQYQLEQTLEVVTPYPYPNPPTTFSQDTRQVSLAQSVMNKLKVAQ